MQDEEKQVIVGDEVKFPLNGRVNSQNIREYAVYGHPPIDFTVDIRNDVRDALHCWCGLTSDGHLIGPRFFDGNMNGAMYLDLIDQYVLPECQRQHVDLQGDFWWLQDGCPAHRTQAVRLRLQELFPGRVVAQGHPRKYPPRSTGPDPVGFFSLGLR